MRKDWEDPPTIDGVIVYAEIGEKGMPDVLHVRGVDVAEDTGNLMRLPLDVDEEAENTNPFVLVGGFGTLKVRHGHKDAKSLIGRRCLVWSGPRYTTVAIEPDFAIVIWCEYR